MQGKDINLRIRKLHTAALRDFDAGNFSAAIENLKSADILDPQNPETLFNLGVSHCRKEQYVEAIDYFTRLIGLPRSSTDILTVLKLVAYSLIRLEMFAQALAHAEEGLALMGDDTVLLNIAAYCHEKEGRPDEAISLYRKILEIDSLNATARNSLAYTLALNDGDLNEALDHVKAALKNAPDNPAYLDTIGFVYLKKGNADMSREYLKKALSIMPNSREIKNHVNMLLKIKGSQNN